LASRQDSLQVQQEISRLEQLQDQRQLIEQELQAHREAKNRVLGLAAIQKIKLRQRSHLTWIRVGDANTKLFHLRANARRRRNYIPSLQYEGRTCITPQAKSTALQEFYSRQFGTPSPRHHTVNWETLQLQRHDLSNLDREVTEQEIHAAVMQTSSEKAPGPDGFIGSFYKECWNIIKLNIITVIKEMFAL
jgi:hypothetical protein